MPHRLLSVSVCVCIRAVLFLFSAKHTRLWLLSRWKHKDDHII